MKDPAFLADMTKAKLPVHPITGEDAEKTINELIGAPPKIVVEADLFISSSPACAYCSSTTSDVADRHSHKFCEI